MNSEQTLKAILYLKAEAAFTGNQNANLLVDILHQLLLNDITLADKLKEMESATKDS
jgi:hypothetical protein